MGVMSNYQGGTKWKPHAGSRALGCESHNGLFVRFGCVEFHLLYYHWQQAHR